MHWTAWNVFLSLKISTFFCKKKYFFLQKKVLFFGKKKYFFLAKKSTSRHVADLSEFEPQRQQLCGLSRPLSVTEVFKYIVVRIGIKFKPSFTIFHDDDISFTWQNLQRSLVVGENIEYYTSTAVIGKSSNTNRCERRLKGSNKQANT